MDQSVKQESPEALNKRILRWRQWLTGFGALLILSYVIYFGVLLGQNPAKDADKWGQFGDFFGGMLNPLVAFAAFYWLTQSVKIQKTELELARKAAEESSLALKQQVLVSRESVNIAAATALLNTHQQEIEGRQQQINTVKATLESGQYMAPTQRVLQETLLKVLTDQRDLLIAEREKYKNLLLIRLSAKWVES